MSYRVRTLTNVRVPMRDGVHLSAEVYLPAAEGPFPTVLMRTPYQNNTPSMVEKGRRYANLGYAFVMQDCRGRYDSDGDFYAFEADAEDGFDTQQWIGAQPWSTGRVGMTGPSYLGWVQWASAPLQSPHLACLALQVMAPDLFRGLFYRGGVMKLATMMSWARMMDGRVGQVPVLESMRDVFRTLPLVESDVAGGYELPVWRDWFDHPTYDEYWQRFDFAARFGEITVPVYNMGGWYDMYANDTCNAFAGLQANGGSELARRSKLLMGPWGHGLSLSTKVGDVDFGVRSLVDIESLELRWFDHFLRDVDNGVLDEPPVRLYVMGANVWRDEHEWPLARTDWQQWFLHSGGRANTLLGDGTLSRTEPREEQADTFVYHPAYPAQTVGDGEPQDQRDVEMRTDVLCYTSEPLREDLEVTGPIKVVLYAATDALDTDWTGKLVDVLPNGYALSLCDGVIRARYRDSVTELTLLEPGEVYRYEIDLMVTSNMFRRGHCIRVEISSSNFPRYDRNLNTGNPHGKDAELRPARQTVLHSAACPSHIVLPVIPAA